MHWLPPGMLRTLRTRRCAHSPPSAIPYFPPRRPWARGRARRRCSARTRCSGRWGCWRACGGRRAGCCRTRRRPSLRRCICWESLALLPVVSGHLWSSQSGRCAAAASSTAASAALLLFVCAGPRSAGNPRNPPLPYRPPPAPASAIHLCLSVTHPPTDTPTYWPTDCPPPSSPYSSPPSLSRSSPSWMPTATTQRWWLCSLS